MSLHRIVLVTELFPPAVGGSATLFSEVYLRLKGIPVTVLTHDDGASHPDTVGRLHVVRRNLASPEWGALRPSALAFQLRLAKDIRALSRKAKAIVHCGRPIPEGVSALMAQSFSGRPYIPWTHGEDLACALTSREHAFLVKRVYARAAAAIANSRHTASMITALDIPGSAIHVIYPGVDTSRFNPSVDGSEVRRRFVPEGGTLLLSVGRLQRRKGHDLAIAALAALADSVPGLRYVIVGDGDERSRLEAHAESLGVHDRVHFAGEISGRDLPAYFAACDVFVLPNRVDGADAEGFGIVFLEAAATERPAIGGRSGGVPEAVSDGETGLLVGGTDVRELAEAIRRLVDAPELRRRMGASARARVVANFTWDRAALILTELHREIEDRFTQRSGRR